MLDVNIIRFVRISIIKALLRGSKETEDTDYAGIELTDIYIYIHIHTQPPLSNYFLLTVSVKNLGVIPESSLSLRPHTYKLLTKSAGIIFKIFNIPRIQKPFLSLPPIPLGPNIIFYCLSFYNNLLASLLGNPYHYTPFY